jgi:argininosuccinate lyase
MSQLWGGRFGDGASSELTALGRSTHFDWVLAPYDIAGSRAHARALSAAGHLSASELDRMLAALDTLGIAIADGGLSPLDTDEDVHGALERELIAALGPELGGKLRAGRSRNDQIATLIRMYLLDHAAVISREIVRLIDAIAAQAAAHPTTAMPGHAWASR